MGLIEQDHLNVGHWFPEREGWFYTIYDLLNAASIVMSYKDMTHREVTCSLP